MGYFDDQVLAQSKTCWQKTKFKTEKRAMAHVGRRFPGIHWRAYQCPWCAYWHLTKKGGKLPHERI